MTEAIERRLLLDAVATLALAAFSAASAIGLIRVYEGWNFLGDALVLIVTGHLLSYLMRAARVPGVIAVVGLGAVLATLAAWLIHPETFSGFLPSGATWDAVVADLRYTREQFSESVAPVAYEGPWAMLGLVGVVLVVFLGDTFAFRAHGRGEALVPGAVLFVFVAALGTDRGRVRLTLLLVATGLVAVALLRTRFARTPRTMLGPNRNPLLTTLPAASVAAVVVVLGAWALGPRLPGVNEEPWVDTHGRGGGGVTEVVSPLVDIRARLVDQANTELFVMQATAPAYWRVSALPDFDGNTWGLPQRSLEDTRGELTDPGPGSVPNDQLLTITALGGRLVPAAADPVRVDGDGLRYNQDTSTLVRTDRELAAGDVVDIASAMPAYTADRLRAATVSSPPDPIYLELPEDFPQSVVDTAAAATASAANPYDRARTLQDWFRNNFQYSLDAPSGHSVSAIEDFLARGSGYCEQFAGTFAAMARSLGMPARVAVGFTTGLTRADGAFSVLGKNAHAWPEIWFDGFGWVQFEPTPGRGAPGVEDVTGVAPQQDDTPPPGAEAAASELPMPVPMPEMSIPVNGPDRADLETPGTPDSVPVVEPEASGGLSWAWVLGGAAVLGLLLAAPAIGRRLRRSQVPSDPGTRIAELWARARRAVESSIGRRFDPTLTPLEQARQVSPVLPPAAEPLRALAEVATAATYAPASELTDAGIETRDPAQGPLQWCHEIERVANDHLTPAGRMRRYFTEWR